MRYEVTTPDGRRFEIEAPAGVNPDVLSREVEAALGRPARASSPGLLAGIAMGALDPVEGGAQALVNTLPRGVVDAVNAGTAFVNDLPVIGPITRALGMTPATPEAINQRITERERDYQAAREAAGETGMDLPRAAGAFIPAAAVALATRNPQTLLQAVGQGAAMGAGFGAATPVPDGEVPQDVQRLRNTLGGAALGAGGGAAGYAVGRLIAPAARPQQQALREAGVELTPGQAIGGVARRMEERAASIPVLGDAIAGGQRRSIETFNRAVANRALEPLRVRVPDDVPVGRDLVGYVRQTISAAYDDAIARARPFGPDRQFAADIRQLSRDFLTPNSRQAFAAAVRDRVLSRMYAGQIDGATYQTIRSDLGRLAREYGSSADPAARELGRAFDGLRDAMQGLLARSNPTVAPQLRAADRAYSMYLRMADAAGRQGATDGIFTPAQLAAAVRSGDATLRRNAYARGDALLQDLSDAGRAVISPVVPNSGTADRLMTAGLGGAIGAGAVPLPALAAAGAGAAAYSRPISNLIASIMLAERGIGARAAGDALVRAGAPISVPLGAYFASPPPQFTGERP